MYQQTKLRLALQSSWKFCIMALATSAAVAQQLMPIERLEQAFWACDYTATTRGIFATSIEHCTAVTDGLKNAKFGGDFHALLAWWRENKPAEHGRLKAINNTR
jgi:hypothetical protein